MKMITNLLYVDAWHSQRGYCRFLLFILINVVVVAAISTTTLNAAPAPAHWPRPWPWPPVSRLTTVICWNVVRTGLPRQS